jgi:hypothetical protein
MSTDRKEPVLDTIFIAPLEHLWPDRDSSYQRRV